MDVQEKGWSDRAVDTGDLKEVFSRVRSDSPIPDDIRERARFLCAHYLGGAWKTGEEGKFTIKQITGGMSNLLFLVQLCDSLPLKHSEPRRALLRIHCQTDIDQLLTESVVFTLLSERKLGPRLLGVFPGGRFEEFIPSRPLQCLEISQPRFISKIGPMLARVHSLEVPVGKEPQIVNRMRGWLGKWSEYAASQSGIKMDLTRAKVDPSLFPAHLSMEDLSAEVAFVEKFLDVCRSPIIFSHNDLQEGNVLLMDKESAGDTSSSHHEDELALIDFEYCNYSYRGFDLGNHACEYGLDYACEEQPAYHVYPEKMRAEKERRDFCRGYMETLYEMTSRGERVPEGLISGDRDKDLQQLEREALLFMPISNLFWSLWSFLNAEESSIEFGYAEYGRDRLAMYFEGKQDILKYMNTV